MKDLKHYFQTSPNSSFQSLVLPSNSSNVEIETSPTSVSKNADVSEINSSNPNRIKEKPILSDCSEVKSPYQKVDEEESLSPNSFKEVEDYPQSSKRKPKGKNNDLNPAITNGGSEGKPRVSEVYSNKSRMEITIEADEESNVDSERKESEPSENVVSPNAFQILMSTQQVFSSTNSGKKNFSEDAEEMLLKKENKRRIKDSLEQMSKRKLNMENIIKENSIEMSSKKRRRIIQESDSDDDDSRLSKKLSVSVKNESKIDRKNKPELDITFAKNQRLTKSLVIEKKNCTDGKKSTPEKVPEQDIKSKVSRKLNQRKLSNKTHIESDSNTLSKKANDKNADNASKFKGNVSMIHESIELNIRKSGEENSSNVPCLTLQGNEEKNMIKHKIKNEGTSLKKSKNKKNVEDEEGSVGDECVVGNDKRHSSDKDTVKNKRKENVKKTFSKTVNSPSSKLTIPCENEVQLIENEDILDMKPKHKTAKIDLSTDSNQSTSDEKLCESQMPVTISKAMCDSEVKTSNSDPDLKRKSNLFNYFNKISSEEKKSHSEKIEVKVDVHVPTLQISFQGKSLKKTINKPKSKKGKRETEDDIQLIDSEVIEKPSEDLGDNLEFCEMPSNISKLEVEGPSDKLETSNTEKDCESEAKSLDKDKKVEINSSASNNYPKSFVSSGWKMRIRLSDNSFESGSASKKRVKKPSSFESCKRLKLSNNLESQVKSSKSEVIDNKEEKYESSGSELSGRDCITSVDRTKVTEHALPSSGELAKLKTNITTVKGKIDKAKSPGQKGFSMFPKINIKDKKVFSPNNSCIVNKTSSSDVTDCDDSKAIDKPKVTMKKKKEGSKIPQQNKSLTFSKSTPKEHKNEVREEKSDPEEQIVAESANEVELEIEKSTPKGKLLERKVSSARKGLFFSKSSPTLNETESDGGKSPSIKSNKEKKRNSVQKGILMFTSKTTPMKATEDKVTDGKTPTKKLSTVKSKPKSGNENTPSNKKSLNKIEVEVSDSIVSKNSSPNKKKSKASTPASKIVKEKSIPKKQTPAKIQKDVNDESTPSKNCFTAQKILNVQNEKISLKKQGPKQICKSKTSPNSRKSSQLFRKDLDTSDEEIEVLDMLKKKSSKILRKQDLSDNKEIVLVDSSGEERFNLVNRENDSSDDAIEVLDTPTRSRKSCSSTPSHNSATPRRNSSRTCKRESTPMKSISKRSPAQGKGTSVVNLNHKRLRLKLRRCSPIAGSEASSDSWKSVSPDRAVELSDEDELIFEKKSKGRATDSSKVSDEEILQLMAERKVVLQALKRARGKLAKLLNSDQNALPAQQKTANNPVKSDSQTPANVKLAPLFLKQKPKHPDKVSIQAKKMFLQSGVPEVVKKMVEVQKLAEEQADDHIVFPTVSHVQQKDENDLMWKLEDMLPKFSCQSEEGDEMSKCEQIPVGCFTNCRDAGNSEMKILSAARPAQINVFRNFLQSIKAESPNFPVYRSFRNLYGQNRPLPSETSKAKKRRRSRSSLLNKNSQIEENKTADTSQAMWSMKYRPLTSEGIIGNGHIVTKLKNWLELWIQVKEGNLIQRSGKDDDNSDNDFINDSSDDEKKSSFPKNTVVITGPNGCGKTMTVYTLARELGYKVLEVNAAAKRTGRRILSELMEATQSHQVQSKGDESNSGIKGFFAAKQKPVAKKAKEKEKAKEKGSEQQSNKLSLILVEDVDVVFEDQDEGFVSALSTLISGSKRPIVLVSSDPRCPHLTRFMEKSLVLEFKPVPAKLLGSWLQIICLLEGVRVKLSTMEEILLQNRGDVRKTLMQLQFWVLSGANISEPLPELMGNPEDLQDVIDDSSNSSWVSVIDEKKTNEGVYYPFHSGCLEHFFSDNSSCFLNREKVWWNIPSVMGWNPLSHSRISKENNVENKEEIVVINDKWTEVQTSDTISDKASIEGESKIETDDDSSEAKSVKGDKSVLAVEVFAKNWKNVCSKEDVSVLVQLTDTLSAVECFSQISGKLSFEPERCSWEQDPQDSLSLYEDMRPPSGGTEDLTLSIKSWLVEKSVGLCANQLQPNSQNAITSKVQMSVCEQELRWRENQHAANLELSEAVPAFCWSERRALSIDYIPSLRNISRLEQDRSCIKDKRNNRFFHYLRGLGVHPSPSVLESACSAFNSNYKS